jgi:formylglycine-generating enzyme required for sulfatase activity
MTSFRIETACATVLLISATLTGLEMPAPANLTIQVRALAAAAVGFGLATLALAAGPIEQGTPASTSLDSSARTKLNPKDGLTYVWVPAGSFTMGCSPGDSDCKNDDYAKPAHRVSITRGYWIGQTEVTQEAYQRMTGSNPSKFKGARLPVETVSWIEARAYCQAAGMRLPTEAEWEYAARGGDVLGRYGPLETVAWYFDNTRFGPHSDEQTHEVARKQANGFGLYDMLGNVSEWVADWWEEYSAGAKTNPRGPASGRSRVVRGGSWTSRNYETQATHRESISPDSGSELVGFRCAGE